MNEVVLVGNPNVGKTTLFNNLTGANEKVSNWHGVTVGVKSKLYKHNNLEIKITDLPGIYSLQGFSNEEKIARDYILQNKEKFFINVCDGNNFERCLKLTVELLNLGLKVLVLVNMAECVDDQILQKIENTINAKIVKIDVRKTREILLLKGVIDDGISGIKTQKIFKINKKTIVYNDLKKIFAENDKIQPYKTTDEIDKMVLNKITFLVIFLSVLFLVFYLTFGHVGLFVCDVFKLILNQIAGKMRLVIDCINISFIIKNLLNEVVIDGLISVLSFLPQIVLLTLCFNFLEECGFKSRVAFMLDGVLKKVGLTGKALFSLSMGFGCSTPAVITSRNLENLQLRKRMVMLLPLIPCNAKMPVFLTIVSLFFNNHKYLFVFAIYLLSLLLFILMSFVYKKCIFSDENFMILEMPKYRIPSAKKLLKDALILVKDFLFKVSTVILFFNFLMWFLQNFSFEFKYLSGVDFESSMLYKIASIFTPIFGWVGLGEVKIVAAIFMGCVAKELVLSGLILMDGLGVFAPISALVFLCFVLIYSPCISALVTIKNELGRKVALYVFVVQFALAFVVSFLVNQILLKPFLLIWLVLVFVVDILVCVVLKLKKKKTCRGNCCACRRI